MTDREAKTRAVKILAKSIYRDLEAQGFDEKQIVALATELISEVTTKISRDEREDADSPGRLNRASGARLRPAARAASPTGPRRTSRLSLAALRDPI